MSKNTTHTVHMYTCMYLMNLCRFQIIQNFLIIAYMDILFCFRDIEHYDECRKVFQMGINSASDDPDGMCEEMLQFEREHGSLETFETALEKCSAQLKRVRERREKVSY